MAYAATPAATPSADSPAPAGEARAPPTIDSHGGKLTPITCFGDCGGPDPFMASFLLVGPVAAVLYGLAFAAKPPSLFRTVLRVMPLAILALVVLVHIATQAHRDSLSLSLWSLLCAAFALFAVSDAFLASETPRRRRAGLIASLGAHLGLLTLFALGSASWTGTLLALSAAAGVLAIAAAFGTWLWRRSAAGRGWALAVWASSAIATGLSMLHLQDNNAWTVGALFLLGADAVLLGKLAKDPALFPARRLTAWLAWFPYCAAQIAFLIGMVGYTDRF